MAEEKGMGEEKRNKIVAAVTVNAILLVFIIIAVLVAQIVQISVLKRRKNQLISELQALYLEYEEKDQLKEDLENGLYEDIDSAIYTKILQLKQVGMSTDDILQIIGISKTEPVLAVVVG
ncbi:MAG: hypothetical protein NC131_09515 [Roseburia sp.]|nr:hypothetical protein [Roseburia sp.]